MKGKTYNPKYPTQQGSCSDFTEKKKKKKLYRQAKDKRIQHHQTSFTTNAKGNSLAEKKKPLTRNKL